MDLPVLFGGSDAERETPLGYKVSGAKYGKASRSGAGLFDSGEVAPHGPGGSGRTGAESAASIGDPNFTGSRRGCCDEGGWGD